MSGESVSSHGELIPVPSQRRMPPHAVVRAGERALQSTTALEIALETAGNTDDPAIDTPITIPAQAHPSLDTIPDELPLTEELTLDKPDELANPPTTMDTAQDPDESAKREVWKIVTRVQQGDKEAFAQLYEGYHNAVLRFIHGRIQNRATAEELTSETFLRAFRHINDITWQGRDIGAWFFTIARNLIADHFKSSRFRLESPTGEPPSDRPDPDRRNNPETAATDYLTNRTLLTAVNQLNPEQRQCIVLRFLQGLSVAEVAQAMGKNEGAVKALQYRAVRNLRQNLPEGFTPL